MCFRLQELLLFTIAFVMPVNLQSMQCPVNEHWVKCKVAAKGPQTCDQSGTDNDDRGYIGHRPCFEGCLCNKGYLRDKSSVCVPERECPSCGHDFNATKGTGQHCGNLCSNYQDPYAICGERKSFYSCDCKKGYVFDDLIGKCVHPSDCPKGCKGDFHAIRKDCASVNQRTCANPKPKKTTRCIQDGCECADNYILDRPGGKCIKITDCPDDGCGGDANATITTCDVGRATCGNRFSQWRGCGNGFSYGCKCKYGYILKDSNGPCILDDDCHWQM